ncbi:MAG: methytransferase partner Trm112 [Dehalococcoidia bacterium]|nr:methytransferase partner Trm112 [Dehalococcoidia bacterium]
MRRELLSILACPVCKGPLELQATEEDDREVVSGSLYCDRCRYSYPIVDTIPNLMPPEPGARCGQGE